MDNSAFRIIREMFYGAATTSDDIGFVDINDVFTFVVYQRIENDAFVLWINNNQSDSGEYLDYALYYIPEAPEKMPDDAKRMKTAEKRNDDSREAIVVRYSLDGSSMHTRKLDSSCKT